MTTSSLKISLKNEIEKIKTNIFMLFYISFIVLFISNLWVLISSVKVVVAGKNQEIKIQIAKGVSLKNEEYEQSLKRIKDGKNYFPPAPLFQNPFGKE